ncbi:MAG: hypothetical protein GF308_19470 [Candidatus Heimdallarchaeota archaeon]|nr:hypothetical protein [Candidatus Heimdallarchaeota archaeon]
MINDFKNNVRYGYDFFPITENGEFIIPGSSLRGVLRSHAEKIARTIVNEKCENPEDFLRKCPACNPGALEQVPLTACNEILKKKKLMNTNGLLRKTIINNICLACQFFGCSFLKSKIHISDGSFSNSFPILMKKMDFVAIDRFTGGGKWGAKFDALFLWNPKFKVKIFIENPIIWQLGWLMLVIKDLKDGLISLGAKQNNWFGKIFLNDVEFKNKNIKIGFINKQHAPFINKNVEIKNEGLLSVQKYSLKSLIDHQENPIDDWIEKFREVLHSFSRNESSIPSEDTYFRNNIPNLYPHVCDSLNRLNSEKTGGG